MGRQGYVGGSEDVQRIARQQKEREEERKKFDEARNRAEKAGTSSSGTGLNFKQFGAGSSEALEQNFRNETVGLVTREEFAEKRATLQERFEEEEKERKRLASEQALKDRRRKRSELKAKANKLSFADEDEDEDGEEGDAAAADLLFGDKSNPFKKSKKFSNFGKNPDADTSFLPDKDRELEQEKRRDELREEFLKEEELAKKKPLKIVYSYWNGHGNRKETTVMQGDTVGAFLKNAQEQLSAKFREVRSSSVDDLLYIKEDLILQHHLTFHELIVNKARGKSGPLFSFDVHDDVRLQADARVEKEESHAGKVVERHWYDKNKHIFPANRWEEYDPKKTYDKYTIH